MSGSDPDQGGKQGPGFVVIDKRGRERDDAPEEPVAEAADATASGPEQQAGAARGPGDLPQVDFATLVLSLGTSAMMHLGLVADPTTGQPAEKNLQLAHQTIDTLEMLQGKTRGNLEPDEDRLLQNLLTELRMRYVEASR